MSNDKQQETNAKVSFDGVTWNDAKVIGDFKFTPQLPTEETLASIFRSMGTYSHTLDAITGQWTHTFTPMPFPTPAVIIEEEANAPLDIDPSRIVEGELVNPLQLEAPRKDEDGCDGE